MRDSLDLFYERIPKKNSSCSCMFARATLFHVQFIAYKAVLARKDIDKMYLSQKYMSHKTYNSHEGKLNFHISII